MAVLVTDFEALRRGQMYEVTHRAGDRVMTHTGEYELDQWFVATVSHETAWGKVVPKRRRFSVYPSEFLSALEIEAPPPPPPPPVHWARRRRR